MGETACKQSWLPGGMRHAAASVSGGPRWGHFRDPASRCTDHRPIVGSSRSRCPQAPRAVCVSGGLGVVRSGLPGLCVHCKLRPRQSRPAGACPRAGTAAGGRPCVGSNLCSLAAAAPPQQSPHRSPAISHRSASASELQSPPNARSRRQSELTHWRQRLLSARLHSTHHGGRRRDAHPRLGAECGGCLVDRHSGMLQLLAGWRESKPAGLPSAVRRTRRTSRFGWL